MDICRQECPQMCMKFMAPVKSGNMIQGLGQAGSLHGHSVLQLDTKIELLDVSPATVTHQTAVSLTSTRPSRSGAVLPWWPQLPAPRPSCRRGSVGLTHGYQLLTQTCAPEDRK